RSCRSSPTACSTPGGSSPRTTGATSSRPVVSPGHPDSLHETAAAADEVLEMKKHNMTRWTAFTLACATALLLPAQARAAQGVVLVQTMMSNGAPTTSEVQVTKQHMRADVESPNGRQT